MKNLTLLQKAELSDKIFNRLSIAYGQYVRQGESEEFIKKLLEVEAKYILRNINMMTPKQMVAEFFNRL